jgi:threonyl-tRNA synthetase
MIFDFIIVPIDNTYIDLAYYVRYKLEDIYCISHIIIDENYNDSFSSRINRSRSKQCNIISINKDYEETNIITVIFQHTGFKVETMTIREFLDVISNYKFENDEESNKNIHCIII